MIVTRPLYFYILTLGSSRSTCVKYSQGTTRGSKWTRIIQRISWRKRGKKIYKESPRFSKYWHMYTFTLDSRDFHDTLQNWSTVTTFEIRAPRIETWNGSKLLLFIFSLFYIQYSGRFFCIFQMNEKLCKKKKDRNSLYFTYKIEISYFSIYFFGLSSLFFGKKNILLWILNM